MTYQHGELGGLNIELQSALKLEEWEAEGLLKRLRQVHKQVIDAKSGKHSIGGVDEADAFAQGDSEAFELLP